MGVRPRFFSAVGRLSPEDQVGRGIPIPNGWTDDYWLGRPVWAGMCSWVDLCNGNVTMIELMEMHRSLNLKGYLEAEEYKMMENKK